jgi:hypothetical protein
MTDVMKIKSSWCFINTKHKIIKFKPEAEIKDLEYNKELWERIFPGAPGVNLKNLKLTNIGKYSAAKIHVSDKIVISLKLILKGWYPKLKLKNTIITESNGGMGSLTIALAKCVKKVNVVEIIKEHIDIIKNNVSQYKLLPKVDIIHADYMDIAYKLKQDIIVADPPWGGTDYNKVSRIRLHLNNVDITCIINNLYIKNKFKIFILLVPYNFDIKMFIEKSISKSIFMHKYGGLYALFILNK